MDFPRIDEALRVCRRHLSGLDDDRSTLDDDDRLLDKLEIESLLPSSVVLLIVSHYENHIAERFAERAARSGDPEVANFVKRQIERRFRSPRIGDINKALDGFGADCRMRFAGRVTNTKAHAAWDTIVNTRHGIVHGSSSVNMTFRELEAAYRESHEVLTALAASLGLPEVPTT